MTSTTQQQLSGPRKRTKQLGAHGKGQIKHNDNSQTHGTGQIQYNDNSKAHEIGQIKHSNNSQACGIGQIQHKQNLNHHWPKTITFIFHCCWQTRTKLQTLHECDHILIRIYHNPTKQIPLSTQNRTLFGYCKRSKNWTNNLNQPENVPLICPVLGSSYGAVDQLTGC